MHRYEIRHLIKLTKTRSEGIEFDPIQLLK